MASPRDSGRVIRSAGIRAFPLAETISSGQFGLDGDRTNVCRFDSNCFREAAGLILSATVANIVFEVAVGDDGVFPGSQRGKTFWRTGPFTIAISDSSGNVITTMSRNVHIAVGATITIGVALPIIAGFARGQGKSGWP